MTTKKTTYGSSDDVSVEVKGKLEVLDRTADLRRSLHRAVLSHPTQVRVYMSRPGGLALQLRGRAPLNAGRGQQRAWVAHQELSAEEARAVAQLLLAVASKLES